MRTRLHEPNPTIDTRLDRSVAAAEAAYRVHFVVDDAEALGLLPPDHLERLRRAANVLTAGACVQDTTTSGPVAQLAWEVDRALGSAHPCADLGAAQVRRGLTLLAEADLLRRTSDAVALAGLDMVARHLVQAAFAREIEADDALLGSH